jgi:hypothetical protein
LETTIPSYSAFLSPKVCQKSIIFIIIMEHMGYHASVTKISKLSMHKVSYHTKLEADRPDGGRVGAAYHKKTGSRLPLICQ